MNNYSNGIKVLQDDQFIAGMALRAFRLGKSGGGSAWLEELKRIEASHGAQVRQDVEDVVRVIAVNPSAFGETE